MSLLEGTLALSVGDKKDTKRNPHDRHVVNKTDSMQPSQIVWIRVLVATLLSAAPSPLADNEPRWSGNLLSQLAEWYQSGEARAIADSVLQYQSPQGGWPKNTNLSKPPQSPEDGSMLRDNRANSFDNGATTRPMMFLAKMVTATDEKAYQKAFHKGLQYILAAQYPNGGWPQFWPLRKGYHAHITFNDDAMIRVLTVLKGVVDREAPYAFVNETLRRRAEDALAAGIECILQTQIKQNGVLTAWCAQHDQKTLEPAWARAYEPPSISGGESVGIIRFLMSLDAPSEAVKKAIDAAVAWLSSVEIIGYEEHRRRGPDGRFERFLVPNPEARGLWARFYELGTNRPLYLDRDSVYRYDFREIGYERRSGYSYHGTWAASLLKHDYPRWKELHGSPSSQAPTNVYITP